MLSISLNPTLLLLQFVHIAVAQRAERTLVRVVWCLGSLRLLEPSRITQTMPVGCTPFLSSLHFFLPLSNSPFFFFLLSLSSTLKLLQYLLYLCISAAPHDLSSFSVLPYCLLLLSLSASSLSLFLKYLLVELIFAGLPKGAQGERKLYAAHACQMWCRARSL